MRIFVLFQDHSYTHERMGNYIWAPEKDFSDIGKYNWQNIQRMQKGDVIYSIVDSKIVSVNIATSECDKRKKPIDLDIPAAGEGYYITANYSQLKKPILLNETLKEKIANLSKEREIPFDEKGNPNEGHVFEIPYEAHKYIMGLISMYNFNNYAGTLDLPELQDQDVALVHQVEHLVEKYDSPEHKTLAIRMGILETVLKQRLLRHTKKCAICDIDYDEYLSAVYCKPWDEASTTERLDINNLLLMCPLHRDMFERGFISFNDKGMIKISSQMRFENFKALSINMFTSINMTEEQVSYMEWHSENIFRK